MLNKDNNPEILFETFIQALRENSRIDRIFDIYNQGEPNKSIILFTKLIKPEN